jgi:hypothetical protein
MTDSTFTIPACLLHVVKDRTAKLNKRAKKLGMDPVTLIVGTIRTVPSHRDNPAARPSAVAGQWEIDMVDVTVDGVAPVVEGYRFIATVECRGEHPIIRRMPGTDTSINLREFTQINTDRCDHCHKNRRRTDILILQETATGKVMQIGKTCAADFFRSKDAAKLIQCFARFSTVGETDYDDFDKMPKGETYVPVQRVLEVAAAVVRVFGFVSTAKERDEGGRSTKSRVYENMFGLRTMFSDDRAPTTDADTAKAGEVYDWLEESFLGKPVAERSEFEQNVAACIEYDGVIRERNFGYIVWMIDGLQRQKDRNAARAVAQTANAASDYVGTVGQRENFTAKLVSLRDFPGWDGGTKSLLRFVDARGNVILWWASQGSDLPTGVEYGFTATVKKHDEYRGTKQTTVQRVNITRGDY